MLETQPSYFTYDVTESMKRHTLKAWNRPTASWSLECETVGKTREEALKKTTIQLVYFEDHVHVASCGFAIVVLYPFMLCAGLCFGCVSKLAGQCVATYSCCIRFCWLIIGVIMIVSLGNMRSAAEANHSRSDEFEIINECAEEFAHVQIDEIKDAQLEEIEKIDHLWTLCFAAFMMMVSEVCCGLSIFCCAVGCKACHEVGTNFSRNCDQLCKQSYAYMSLIKVGG